MKLLPRDANHPPAGRPEAAVAGAVGLEGMCDRVVSAAVELDDEAGGGPDAVDLESPNEDVGARERKTGIEEKGLEALFELLLDDVQAQLGLLNYSFEDWDAGLAWVSGDQVAHPQRIGEPKLLGLPHGASELVALNDSTEVEQRAGHGRGRDAEMVVVSSSGRSAQWRWMPWRGLRPRGIVTSRRVPPRMAQSPAAP